MVGRKYLGPYQKLTYAATFRNQTALYTRQLMFVSLRLLIFLNLLFNHIFFQKQSTDSVGCFSKNKLSFGWFIKMSSPKI